MKAPDSGAFVVSGHLAVIICHEMSARRHDIRWHGVLRDDVGRHDLIRRSTTTDAGGLPVACGWRTLYTTGR